MRTSRKSRKLHEQYDLYELDNYYDVHDHKAHKSYTRSSKNRVHLDEEDFDEYDFHDSKQRQRCNRHKSFVQQACNEVFKCKNCRRFIGPPLSGGRHRNHCPFCLYSLHVDGDCSGDRLSVCRSRMEPIGHFQRAKGEYVLVHRCRGCGFERFNRIAADDNFELVLALPVLPQRTKHHVEA